MKELQQVSGKQLDPDVVRLMVQAGPTLQGARQNSIKTVTPLKDLAEAV